VIAECGFTAHSNADDTQVYISTPASGHSDAMRRLSECITRIRDWMACNRLKLNEDKTQTIWLGTRHQLSKVTTHVLTLPNATVQFSGVVNDLGVLLNSQLTMADHVAALSRSSHMRQLRSINQSLSSEATTKLISSRLDYCNSLLVGVSGQLLHRLQVIQNAAARLVTGATRYEHMTPVLRSLRWLPVRHRIMFKTAVTVYKCLHGLTPPCLTEYCTSTSSAAGRRHLRSAYTRQLIILRTRTSYDDRSFAVHGPVVWNSPAVN